MNAPRTRVQRRPVHGVLLLDKPLGLSSNQALQKAKWLLRAEKAGHTGTLDPLATGVLPLCFGAATKFSQLHLDADKTYEADARLGVKTVDRRCRRRGDRRAAGRRRRADDLARVAAQFTGPIRQVPPMHSALKKDGKALYEYAREGVEVERAARDVVIHELATRGRRQATDIRDRATVSKGTYIRTLGEDIGEALGCGAHLTALRRIATGGFDVSQCVTLEALEAMGEEERLAQLLPTEALVADHTPRHARRRRCGALPVAACAGAATGPTREHVRRLRRRAARIPRHGPRQGRRTDPGALAEPHRNPANTFDRSDTMSTNQIRNIAIIAHVDHGKTTHGRPAAAPVRHLRRARESGRHRDGQQRHRKRARHHDPGQELRRDLEGHAHQHRRHPRPRGLRRRSGTRAVHGGRRGAADRRRRKARCRRRAS